LSVRPVSNDNPTADTSENIDNHSSTEGDDNGEEEPGIAEDNTECVPITLDNIRVGQLADDSIGPVLQLVKDGVEPSTANLRPYPEEARVLLAQWDSLVVENDVLYRRFHHPDGSTQFLQVVLPTTLRRSYVEQLHRELDTAVSPGPALQSLVEHIFQDGDRSPS